MFKSKIRTPTLHENARVAAHTFYLIALRELEEFYLAIENQSVNEETYKILNDHINAVEIHRRAYNLFPSPPEPRMIR